MQIKAIIIIDNSRECRVHFTRICDYDENIEERLKCMLSFVIKFY